MTVILKDKLDLFNSGDDKIVDLLTVCGGSQPNRLDAVEPGPAKLLKGKLAIPITITQEEGADCVQNSISVGPGVSKRLNLKFNVRYLIEFDTVKRTMRLFERPIIRGKLSIRIGTNITGLEEPLRITNQQIFLSQIAQAGLGVNVNQIIVRHGLLNKVLEVVTTIDEFPTPFMQVTPVTAKQLLLIPKDTQAIFNQIQSVLHLNPGK